MTRPRRLPALLLAGVLSLGVMVCPAGAVDYPEKEHLPVDYADMTYTGFDDDALQDIFAQLQELERSGALDEDAPGTRERVEALYEALLWEYDRLSTQYCLIDLRRDADVTDQWAADECADFGDRFNYTADQCRSALALLAGSPSAGLLEEDAGKDVVDSFLNYEPMTEEEAELYRREEELVQRYESVMAGEYTVTDGEGRSWTARELYEDPTLTNEEYYRLLTELEMSENAAAGPIFLELVELRTRLARLCGYDSYAEYAYRELYNRDYDPEEIQRVYRQVKKELVPLYAEILDRAGDEIYTLDSLPAVSGEEILDAIGPFMDRIHPELGETFRFMRRHHLYDIEAAPNKNGVGYTVALPAYGSAFIFNSPYGGYQDWSTMIHEFGHFNETFHAADHELWADFSIDVGEIHSQGLEVLFIEYAQELFGKNGRGFGWNTLLSMVDSVLDGCLYDEFQAAVYGDPDMTLEEMNALFHELSLEYGYPDRGDGASYFWVEVPHNFQQPMYYISYATSALSAIDLYLLSREDRPQAVETYMELTVLSMTLPYQQAVRQVGLRDIFSAGTVEELADGLAQALEADFGGAAPRKTRAPRRQETDPFRTVLLIALALAALALTVTLLTVLLVRRRALIKRRREEDRTPAGGWEGRDPWD